VGVGHKGLTAEERGHSTLKTQESLKIERIQGKRPFERKFPVAPTCHSGGKVTPQSGDSVKGKGKSLKPREGWGGRRDLVENNEEEG